MKVSLNNEPVEVAGATTLSAAIELWQFGGQTIAVAINGEFVSRSNYATRILEAGDRIDIVKPVGGG
ncbi:sulfur carrier protein ThiS [Exilibacterium tricleocarpae]|uniref:sulfur carrier protein ThiS n=1 Tax=Exilibacterium tricleocarpae TaxID=2591008 RepID=UPI001FEC8B5C|nr:sulfur carrier protein ThiS [Exilibacterium tricleocarpae]